MTRIVSRRKFLHETAIVAAGSAAMSSTALSCGRIVGANDRISLGHIGVGVRGSELYGMAAELKDSKNVEISALCDLWNGNLERAVSANHKLFGKAPRAVRHAEELLALPNIDAVIISTPEHSHSLLLKMVVEPGQNLLLLNVGEAILGQQRP